jgi:hypothetical protein
MKASVLLVLFTTYFSFLAKSQISVDNLSTVYRQSFDSLAQTTSSATPYGWLFVETGTNANNTYAADNGSTLSGNTYSYGTTGLAERAFGTLQSGSLISTIGAHFANNSGSVITAITITYYGEEWRLGVAGRTDQLDFQRRRCNRQWYCS